MHAKCSLSEFRICMTLVTSIPEAASHTRGARRKGPSAGLQRPGRTLVDKSKGFQ
jgi:hypothetical protein